MSILHQTNKTYLSSGLLSSQYDDPFLNAAITEPSLYENGKIKAVNITVNHNIKK